MAIRFQRVLIACGLPTIIAIVSFYWLRKRRKAVVHNTSLPKQSSKETNIKSIDRDLESKTIISIPIEENIENNSSEKQNTIQSKTNCDSNRFETQYIMQLRDNNNTTNTVPDSTNACDTGARQQYITDDNSTNSMAKQIENSNSNNNLGFNQINCETNGNEYNCEQNDFNSKYNNINEDKIVVKLSNFSLNNDDNKDIPTLNEFEINGNKDETNKNLTKRDSNNSINCDKNHKRENNTFGQTVQHNDSNSIEPNVGSHNDNNDSNECKSITNPLNDGTSSQTNSKQLIQVLNSDLIDAQKQNNSNSSQISIEVNNCVMSQNNDQSIDNITITSSACSSSASCQLTNGYDNGDIYQNYPDSVSNCPIDHSPPHSAFSDVQSEGSSDSGKGGSDILHTTPVEGPNLSLNPINETVIYQFEIPQYLCGRLIGSCGRFVAQIKQMTSTSVVINKHTFSSDMRICTLTGTKPAIKEALNQIRNRFPINDYPSVSLHQINLINATQTYAVPQTCQLQLASGISCDVILSSLVSAGHFFLQQPTHPTYPSLSRLDHFMIQTYSHQNTPLIPNIHSGMVCAVPIMGGWYRAVVTKVYDSEECDVMFVDYGGYSRLPVSSLRQIRFDFMTLPFQASECYLANVEPIDPEIGWTAEANTLFEELAQGQILQALIVGYSENGIPLVHLFKVQGISNVFINQELVNQSHAQWVDSSA